MNKVLTVQESQELIVAKTKSLMNITKKILNKNKTPIQTNSNYIISDMIKIEAGSYMMGSDELYDERPIHKVIISKPFLIGKYQITFKEYDKFCKDTKKDKPSDWGWGRENRPVIKVSWNDANEYCKWLSQKTGKTYQLPSETQWEYSVRARTTTIYSFGDDEDKLKEYAWYEKNSEKKHIQ